MGDNTRRQIKFIRMSKMPSSKRDLNIDLVKKILNERRDVNDLIRECYTPLYLASLAGDMSLVKLLLDKGADVDRPSKGGETPLYVACEVGYPDIVETLLDGGAKVTLTDTLKVACKHGHYEVVKVLLEKSRPVEGNKPIINSPDAGFPLHIACLTGNVNIVQLLLETGADLFSVETIRTNDGPVFFSPNGDYQKSL